MDWTAVICAYCTCPCNLKENQMFLKAINCVLLFIYLFRSVDAIDALFFLIYLYMLYNLS